jgi:hypothetical protein
LSNQPATAGSQRRASGDFFAARGQSRKKQIGKVDTSDQDYQGYRALERQEYGPEVSDEVLLQSNDADAIARV